MTQHKLALSPGSKASEQNSAPVRRISQSEWPRIVARYGDGERISAIARDYGVTGPAIRYILKKAEAKATKPEGTLRLAETAAGSLTERAAGPGERETASEAAGAPEGDTGDLVSESGPEEKPEEKKAENVADTAAAGFLSPLAQRLAETSRSCCLALDDRLKDRGEPGAVAAALHQVRRALAAIEIDLLKQEQGVSRNPGQGPYPAPETAAKPGTKPGAKPGLGERAEMARAAPAGSAGNTSEGAIEGTVKFFDPDKGFGFVTLDDGHKDVFVHIRTVERSGLATLEPKQRVRLTTSMGQKGPQAETVALL